MKRCISCTCKGIFLKLKNGLCENCYNELISYENQYEQILAEFSKPEHNPNKLIASINLLMIKLRKYNNVTNSIKLSDCDKLIDILSKELNPKTNPTIKETTPNIDITNNIKDFINSTPTTIDNFLDTSLNSVNTNIESNDITNTSSTIASIDITDKSSYISTNINLIEETSNDIPPELEPIKRVISEDIYSEAFNIVDTLKDPSLNTDELAYYTFLLKNTYLKTLNQFEITEIDDINLESLISNNLNKISLNLNCSIDSIYEHYNYITFSIQTTGSKVPLNDIIEISALKIRYGHIEDKFHTLINPMKSISIMVQNKTNILNNDLLNAPSLEIALKSFIDFCGNWKLIAHNINYNLGFIEYYYKKLFNSPITNKSECSMKLYRSRYKHFHGDPPQRFSITDCCNDILPLEDLNKINDSESISMSSALGTYKIYEILKTRYK